MLWEKKNFSWLLIALVVFLVVVPVAEDLGVISTRIMRVLMFSWLLTFGVWSLRGFGRFFPIAIGFAVAGVLLSVLTAATPGDSYALSSFTTAALFIVIAVWCVATQVFTSQDITIDRVIGAITLYLLFGVLWAIAYAVIEQVDRGSFAGITKPLVHGWSSDWLYFSFVTMTTLGYGDITPVSATARTFAYLQAVFGQFYITILVAGLVGAYITKYSPPSD
ncbi:MAG: ion channel [Woeseiaceae bacterium]|nr:ion channel [Woeseiaceae bacterium]